MKRSSETTKVILILLGFVSGCWFAFVIWLRVAWH